MKSLSIAFTLAMLLAACSLKEGAEQTGAAIETGAENIVEGVKQIPKAIGDAAHNLDKKINE